MGPWEGGQLGKDPPSGLWTSQRTRLPALPGNSGTGKEAEAKPASGRALLPSTAGDVIAHPCDVAAFQVGRQSSESGPYEKSGSVFSSGNAGRETSGGRGDKKDLVESEAGGRKASCGYLGSLSSFGSFMKCPDAAPAPTRLPHWAHRHLERGGAVVTWVTSAQRASPRVAAVWLAA